jgi:hypothetical protein
MSHISSECKTKIIIKVYSRNLNSSLLEYFTSTSKQLQLLKNHNASIFRVKKSKMQAIALECLTLKKSLHFFKIFITVHQSERCNSPEL